MRPGVKTTKADRAALERENRRWPQNLKQIPASQWPTQGTPGLIEVWRSREYLVQVYRVQEGILRLTVNTTRHDGRHWAESIAWDTLQRLKRECGRGDLDAVEVYPADADIVNVANMRHLFVFENEKLPYAWRKKPPAGE